MPLNIKHMFYDKSVSENPPAIWIIKSGEVTFYSINSTAEKEFLYSEDELLGKSILKVCPSFSLNELIILPNSKNRKKISTKIRRKDGMEQAAKLEITSFNFENDNYFQIVISPLVSSNSAYNELTDYFYSYTFNTSPVPVIILEKKTLKIIQVNDGTIRMYGHSHDEFIGMKFTNLLHPNEADNILRIFNTLKDDSQNRFEIKQVTKSERIIDAEIFIQPVKSFEGDILIITVHDISEKKLALKLLESNLNNYRLIANNSTDLIIRQTLNGKINYASPASLKLLGFTPSFLTINNIYNFIHPADAEKLKKGMHNLTESGQFKTRFRIKDSLNRYIWLESTSTLLVDNKPVPEPEIVLVARDISGQVEIENKLVEANEKAKEIEKLKHIILANISHEMRTPLQSILGFSQNIKGRIDNGELADDIDNIYENGQRLLRMVNLFLNLSYMEANNFLPHFEIYDIISIVKNAAEPFVNTAQKKNITLTIAPGEKPLFVNTDKVILRDILDNLIDNAVKFTQNGKVEISMAERKMGRQNYIVLTIEDSGIGIPPGKENMAIQEFRQISEGLNRNYEGIGLGLSVAKRLAERINARISINSIVGKGTTIEVYLVKEETN
ncbi:MAG: PAS domain S-box protein [Ignavibacteriaceae bacterium]|nr:PAS domain S-box protein [Ignavibacteriaceae bacterium]